MIRTPIRTECHQPAPRVCKQHLYHVSHAGLTFRYPTEFVKADPDDSARRMLSTERLNQLEFHSKVGGLRRVDELMRPCLGQDVSTSLLGLSTVPGGTPVSDDTYQSI